MQIVTLVIIMLSQPYIAKAKHYPHSGPLFLLPLDFCCSQVLHTFWKQLTIGRPLSEAYCGIPPTPWLPNKWWQAYHQIPILVAFDHAWSLSSVLFPTPPTHDWNLLTVHIPPSEARNCKQVRATREACLTIYNPFMHLWIGQEVLGAQPQ